jgi:hypothetical protein
VAGKEQSGHERHDVGGEGNRDVQCEISGRGDVWCRVVATDTHSLQAALRSILRIKGVIRTETVLALHTHIPYRTEPLISRLVQGSAPGPGGSK